VEGVGSSEAVLDLVMLCVKEGVCDVDNVWEEDSVLLGLALEERDVDADVDGLCVRLHVTDGVSNNV